MCGCWTLQWTGFTDLTFDSHPSDDSVSPGQGGGRDESARKATSCRDGIQAQIRMQGRGSSQSERQFPAEGNCMSETNILLGSLTDEGPRL